MAKSGNKTALYDYRRWQVQPLIDVYNNFILNNIIEHFYKHPFPIYVSEFTRLPISDSMAMC